MAATLLFIRHGHSVANRDELYGGNVDFDLTETGMAQAKCVADFVAETYKVDAVVSSPLIRAYKTACAVAEKYGLPVSTDERLREIYGGVWEGLPYADIARDYPKDFAMWQKDISRVLPPKGESVAEVQKRALEAARDIAMANDGKTVAVVAHRCLIRTLQCFWENRALDDINACAWLPNCSVSEVVYENGVITPVNVGQADFMGAFATPAATAM